MNTPKEDFRKKYKQELVIQEVNSNKHTLKGFLWILIALALVWLLNMAGLFEVDKKLVTIALLSTFLLFIPPLYIYIKGDLAKPEIKYFFLFLICVVSGIIVAILSFHAVMLYVIPLLFAIQYRRKKTIWFTYIVNIFTMLISTVLGFYFGLCDLNILLQSQHVRNYYLSSASGLALSLPFNEHPLFVITVFAVLPRSIILFVFAIMMQYTVTRHNKDAYRIAQLTYFKETDTKTGVFNKNKYEEMVTTYYPRVDRIAVIFWDLNNLKYINDKYGHLMGDKMIEKLSSILREYSTDYCRIFRVGGDEFVMIIDYPEPNEARMIMNAVEKQLQLANENAEVKISSAVGHASGRGKQILKVIETADAHMYENKKQCKESRA